MSVLNYPTSDLVSPQIHTNGRIRTIILANELALIREALACMCERDPHYAVVGEAGDGSTCLEMVMEHKPDLAVIDFDLPDLFSLEVIRKVREEGSSTRCVVISTRRDRKTVLDTLRAGASAYLLKSGPGRHLLEAFHHVLEGGVYVSPSLELNQLFTETKKKKELDPVETLSSREYQVFCFLVDGLRAKEIAGRLALSPKTVDTYRASLMRKLNIYDVAGLVKFAIQNNLTTVG